MKKCIECKLKFDEKDIIKCETCELLFCINCFEQHLLKIVELVSQMKK